MSFQIGIRSLTLKFDWLTEFCGFDVLKRACELECFVWMGFSQIKKKIFEKKNLKILKIKLNPFLIKIFFKKFKNEFLISVLN